MTSCTCKILEIAGAGEVRMRVRGDLACRCDAGRDGAPSALSTRTGRTNWIKQQKGKVYGESRVACVRYRFRAYCTKIE